MLWDFAENAPARFLMDYFGFDTSILPDVQPTFSIQGRVTASAAAELGTPRESHHIMASRSTFISLSTATSPCIW